MFQVEVAKTRDRGLFEVEVDAKTRDRGETIIEVSD